MSYRGLGQERTPLGPDIATSVPEAIARNRGWVAIPTSDVREYAVAQLMTAGAGFVLGFSVGVTVGTLLGNVFARKR